MSYETAMKRVWEMKAATSKKLQGKSGAEIIRILDESTRDIRKAIELSRKRRVPEIEGIKKV